MSRRRNKDVDIPLGQPAHASSGPGAASEAPAGHAASTPAPAAERVAAPMGESAATTTEAFPDASAKAGAADSAVGAFPEAPTASAFDEGPAFDLPPQEEVLIRRKHRRKTHRKRNIVIAVVCVLLAAVVGTVAAVAASINAGEEAMRQASQPKNIQAKEEAVTHDEGRTVKYNGHTYRLNENMVSIVVIGYDKSVNPEDPGAGQADAVMVMALDTQTGKLSGIGVPRDAMVDVSEFVGDAFLGEKKQQLCLAFSYGDGGKSSCEYTTTAVSRVLYNMPMSYYIALDYNGIGPLADAVEGVPITPLESIPNTNIVKGQEMVLWGEDAGAYLRWRNTEELSSGLDRQARQSQFVQAYAQKALSTASGNVGMLVDLFGLAGDYSQTNLGAKEFSYLASKLVGNGIKEMTMTTLKATPSAGQFIESNLDQENVYETILDVYYTQVD